MRAWPSGAPEDRMPAQVDLIGALGGGRNRPIALPQLRQQRQKIADAHPLCIALRQADGKIKAEQDTPARPGLFLQATQQRCRLAHGFGRVRAVDALLTRRPRHPAFARTGTPVGMDDQRQRLHGRLWGRGRRVPSSIRLWTTGLA
jgi:hypothetical protein